VGLQRAHPQHFHAGLHHQTAAKIRHASPPRPQHCPYASQPKQFGSKAQRPLPPDASPPLSNANIKHVQRIIGSILYYARAVNLTVLLALSTIASTQVKGTQQTMAKTKQLLDYLATHPNATVRFDASNMILNIHLNALYLSKANTHSRAYGHFFMGRRADPTKPIILNGVFFTLCAILRFVVPSAAEAKLGALFLNCKQATIFLTHARRNGPSPTSNPSTLQQFNRRWHREQHGQTTEILLDGNAFLLGCRCGGTKKI
jgi:hypothetical protein